MALSIKDPEADRLARALAKETGETLTQAVIESLRERLVRQRRKQQAPAMRERVQAIRESLSRLPRLDDRTDDDILGYDDKGVPS